MKAFPPGASRHTAEEKFLLIVATRQAVRNRYDGETAPFSLEINDAQRWAHRTKKRGSRSCRGI
jgi:hypothetical protein